MSGRAMGKRLLLLAATLLLSVLAADLVLRWSGVMLVRYNCAAAWYKERDPHLWRVHRYVPGRDCRAPVVGDLAWMRADRVKGREVTFRADAWGFRNPTTPPGGWQAILLGDSFGAAEVTDGPDTLAARLGAGGVRAYNLSVGPSGIGDEFVRLRYYRRENPELAPLRTVIWMVYEANDLDEVYDSDDPSVAEFGPLRSLGARIEGWYKHAPVRLLIAECGRSGGGSPEVVDRPFLDRTMLFFRPYIRRISRTATELAVHPNRAAMTERFAVIGRHAREHRLDVLVVFIPAKERVYQWVVDGREPWGSPGAPRAVEEFFAGLAREAGFPFLSLTDPLLAAAGRLGREEGKTVWWLDDTHWNGEGQRVACEEILRFLGARGR